MEELGKLLRKKFMYKSLKQKKLILAAAHNPDFAKKVGFKQEAAQKFVADSHGEIEKSKKPRFSKLMKKLQGK